MNLGQSKIYKVAQQTGAPTYLKFSQSRGPGGRTLDFTDVMGKTVTLDELLLSSVVEIPIPGPPQKP